MKVSELATSVGGLRTEVRDLRTDVTELRTEVTDLRTDVNDLRTDVNGLRTSSTELRTEMDRRFGAVDEQFKVVFELIKSEGETTRRHFDVVAEQMLSERNLALDRSMATAQQLAGLTAANASDHVRFEGRLDGHDGRLEAIERSRDTNSR